MQPKNKLLILQSDTELQQRAGQWRMWSTLQLLHTKVMDVECSIRVTTPHSKNQLQNGSMCQGGMEHIMKINKGYTLSYMAISVTGKGVDCGVVKYLKHGTGFHQLQTEVFLKKLSLLN